MTHYQKEKNDLGMSRVFFPTIGMLFVFLAACSAPAMPISPTSTSDADSTVTIQLNPQVTSPALAPPLPTQVVTPTTAPTATRIPSPTPLPLSPLTIQYLRERTFPGSELKIEQTLTPGANYSRYIASYLSEGFKIYGLLTVPKGTKPATGWPVIIFNHGFIPPTVYRTTERYVAYVDAIARSGYIVFKSDYRGHGSSEGDATGGYGSPAYTIDVLNALASVKRMPEADPNRSGMWGHSMGGQVTLRAMVTDPEIKAGVIWAGVVGSYTNLLNRWRNRQTTAPPASGGPSDDVVNPISGRSRRWRQQLIDTYGTPETNPAFWESISPNTYVSDLGGPIQLHHDEKDHEVPYEFAQELLDEVTKAGGSAELFSYPGDDHNLAQSFGVAMQRTLAFFNKYVKQAK